MLSENEMKRLRRARWYSKWTPILCGFFLLLHLSVAGAKLYAVERISARASLTWARMTNLAFHGFDIRETYPGVEIRCASLIQDATLYVIAALFTVLFYFVSRIHQRRDIALLHYAEQDRQHA